MKILLEVIFLIGICIGGLMSLNYLGDTDTDKMLGFTGLIILTISLIVFIYLKIRKDD